jgi:hypothetical protein
VLDFLQLREQCLHSSAIDRLWCAIVRTSLLLSSKHSDGATDGANESAIVRTSLLLSSKHSDGATDGANESAHDRTSLLLSSKHTDGAIDGAIKPSLDSAIDRTWIALDRMEA